MRVSLMLWSRPLAILFAAALTVAPATAFAQNTEQDFKEAYFQQTHQNNLKAAIAAYEKVIANPEAPAALRAESQTRLAQCQEDQAAANFAQLMPADATLYVELRDPGKHVGNILRMVGLAREPQSPSEAAPAGATPLPGGLALPHDISISPALLRDLGKVKGLAASITGVDQRGIPSGVAVIHPGELDLLRGLIETGLQVLPQGEPRRRFQGLSGTGGGVDRCHQPAVDRIRLARPGGAAAARLKNPEADSLAKQPQFSRLASDRDTALAFVYVNGRRALEIARPHMGGQEAMMAQMFLDLGNLESVSAAIGTNRKRHSRSRQGGAR